MNQSHMTQFHDDDKCLQPTDDVRFSPHGTAYPNTINTRLQQSRTIILEHLENTASKNQTKLLSICYIKLLFHSLDAELYAHDCT